MSKANVEIKKASVLLILMTNNTCLPYKWGRHKPTASRKYLVEQKELNVCIILEKRPEGIECRGLTYRGLVSNALHK